MFVLQLPITPSILDSIKLRLTHFLPQVKSSHRCEAMARGLGQRTYASARAIARLSERATATADGSAFTSYLREHGFEIEASHFYRAVAHTALADVSERHPRLTIQGVGAGQPQRLERGRYETAHEHHLRFQARRKELLGEEAAEAFLASLAFLKRVSRTKTVRPKTSSYWIKHIVENFAATYPDGKPLGPRYIPNGALIAAALHAGFDIRTHVDDLGYESLNTTFNMSHSDLIDLDCEIRPGGARAQARNL